MFTLSFLFILVLVTLSLIFSEITLDEGVMVLDESNFDEALSTNEGGVLVEFYAPWCGHCKQLAPEWAKAAQSLASSPIKLAKVDATEAKDLATKFDIKGFPTIKFFRGGNPSEYSGGRTEADIVAWVNKKSSPAYTVVATEEEFAALQEGHSVFVVGAFNADGDAAAQFKSLAGADETLSYAITFSDAVKAKLGVTGEAVVIIKDFDDLRGEHSLANGFDSAAVAEFIAGESTPLIQTFSQTAAKKIFSSPINKHVLFFTDLEADHHASTVATLKPVATSFKGKALFVNVPSTENRVMEFFGITAEQLPLLILADMGNETGLKKFPYNGDITSEGVSAHLANFFSGSLKPHLKSEEVTAEDTAGPVTILKGSSFDDLVVNNEKDVLVEFYAPWCGHCKKLSPIWDDLGAEYESNSNIVIAKMDATANEIDVPGVAVKGFPTIIFFPAGDKANPRKYEGGRELEDFIGFLEENSKYATGSSETAGKDEL